MTTTAVDPSAIEAFVGRFATDLAAVAHAAWVVVGDKLGLYKALAERGPSTAAELAAATGCDERYLLEWLCAQAASEYAHYDPGSGRFHLDEAQAVCLADESSPAFVVGGMGIVSSMHKDEPAIASACEPQRRSERTDWDRTGTGLGPKKISNLGPAAREASQPNLNARPERLDEAPGLWSHNTHGSRKDTRTSPPRPRGLHQGPV